LFYAALNPSKGPKAGEMDKKSTHKAGRELLVSLGEGKNQSKMDAYFTINLPLRRSLEARELRTALCRF